MDVGRISGRLIHDKHGRLCIFQKPNPPLISWIIFTLVSKISNGQFSKVFEVIAFGSLFTWAWLELFQGSCYLRRLFGLVVLVFIIRNRI